MKFLLPSLKPFLKVLTLIIRGVARGGSGVNPMYSNQGGQNLHLTILPAPRIQKSYIHLYYHSIFVKHDAYIFKS